MIFSRLILGAATAASVLAADDVYREPFARSFPIREQQHLQIKAYADKLLREQSVHALGAIEPDFSSPAAYERSLAPHRERLRAFLGTPPPHAKPGTISKFEQVG